jgi:2-succinyl-5-enolpyruvyl-6-hydroxy-3-cyclohexene-1-carboxylate synthase
VIASSADLAAVLVDELIRCGVRDVVLAPGSRSAPLAFSVQAADAAGRLRLHVRIDERSAGFLALGLAKVSRQPVAVVTTSGTAAGNLYPAVLEASESGVPLLVLTADRPPALRATGANQTIDQIKLYGSAVRAFHEVGEAAAGASGSDLNRYWRSLVARAVATASGASTRDAGPVHLNLAFAEPLVPPAGYVLAPAFAGRDGGASWTTVEPDAPSASTAAGWPARTLVVVGDARPEVGAAALRVAEAHGWPIIAEPSSGARQGPNALRLGHLLVGVEAWLARHRPDRLLVVGRPTLHRQIGELARSAQVEVVVAATNPRWTDSARTAVVVVASVPEPAGDRVIDPEWLAGWLRADAAAGAALESVLSESAPSTMLEAAIADQVLASLPPNGLLVAGSSMAIRELALARPRVGVTIVANRGVAGIDGTVSTAIGAALAWADSGRGPVVALLGDLTFLHDINGLVIGPDERRPDLTIVVLDNDGGAIFGLLEQGATEHRDVYERIFGTPHGVDLAAVCAGMAVEYIQIADRDDLATALSARPGQTGIRVVAIRTDRTARRALEATIGQAIEQAIR